MKHIKRILKFARMETEDLRPGMVLKLVSDFPEYTLQADTELTFEGQTRDIRSGRISLIFAITGKTESLAKVLPLNVELWQNHVYRPGIDDVPR